MNKLQKEKLRKIYMGLATDDEKEAMVDERFDSMVKKVNKASSIEDLANTKDELKKHINEMKDEFALLARQLVATHKMSMQAYKDSMAELSDAVGKMGNSITTSYEKNKPFNAAGVYKDMINQLSGVKKSIDDKPVPVWQWPQYASVGVRDTSFKNINPAIAGFNITDPYDYVALTYSGSNVTVAVYKSGGASGRTVATLTLAYSGSNVTSVTRT